jgi:peptide/nickel transport system substrate-binding protein
MKRRYRIGPTLAAAITAAAISLFAASAGSATTKTIPLLRVGVAGFNVSTMDEAHQGSDEYLGLEHLMKLDPKTYRLEPNLARSVTHPSSTTYVYHLRHGIKFWDGNELTAADAAASLNYLRAPGSVTGFYWTSVKSITAPDRYTVVIKLKRPDAGFPYSPASYASAIFEKKFFDEHKATYGKPGTLVMGTGPFIPLSFDPTSGMEFKANPDYWGGPPPIQHISVKFFSDESSEALAMRAGAIDVVPVVNDPQSFASASKAKVGSLPSCAITYFTMPTNRPPWSDVHVRRAVAFALNRPQLIKANGGYASPITTLVPQVSLQAIASKSQVQSLLGSLPQYPYSIARAKAELAKSAFPNGFSEHIDTFSFAPFPTMNEAAAGELKQIGIKLAVSAVPTGKFLKEDYGDPTKRVPGWSTWGCQNPDPSQQSGLLGSANAKPSLYNFADYKPPAVDKLLAAAIATNDPAKRFVAYSKLLKLLATDVPYVPLFVTDVSYAISKNFSWPDFNPFIYSDQIWALGIKAT